MHKNEPQGWEIVIEAEKKRLGPQTSRVHHWWPRGLQKHWAIDGWIYFEDSAGRIDRRSVNNKKFCASGNAHTKIILSNGGIANSKEHKINFESVFSDTDNDIPKVVDFAKHIATKSIENTGKKHFYLAKARVEQPSIGVELTNELGLAVARLALSLLARCPAKRAKHHAMIDRFHGQPVSKEYAKGVIAHDIQSDFERWLRMIESLRQRISVRFLCASAPSLFFTDNILGKVSEQHYPHPTRSISLLSGEIGFSITPSIFCEVRFSKKNESDNPKNCISEVIDDPFVRSLNVEIRRSGKDIFILPFQPTNYDIPLLKPTAQPP